MRAVIGVVGGIERDGLGLFSAAHRTGIEIRAGFLTGGGLGARRVAPDVRGRLRLAAGGAASHVAAFPAVRPRAPAMGGHGDLGPGGEDRAAAVADRVAGVARLRAGGFDGVRDMRAVIGVVRKIERKRADVGIQAVGAGQRDRAVLGAGGYRDDLTVSAVVRAGLPVRGVSGAGPHVRAVARIRPGAPVVAERFAGGDDLFSAADRAAVDDTPVGLAARFGDGDRLVAVLGVDGLLLLYQTVHEQVVECVLRIGGDRMAERLRDVVDHVGPLPVEGGEDHAALAPREFHQRGPRLAVHHDRMVAGRQRFLVEHLVDDGIADQQLGRDRLEIRQLAGDDGMPVVREIGVIGGVERQRDAAGQRPVDPSAGPAPVARAVDQHAAAGREGLELAVQRQQLVVGGGRLVVGDKDDTVIFQVDAAELVRCGDVPAGDVGILHQLVQNGRLGALAPRHPVAEHQHVVVLAELGHNGAVGVAADGAAVVHVAVRRGGGVLVASHHVVVRVGVGQRLRPGIAADGAGVDDRAVAGPAHRRGIGGLLVTVLRRGGGIVIIAAARTGRTDEARRVAGGFGHHLGLIVVAQRRKRFGIRAADLAHAAQHARGGARRGGRDRAGDLNVRRAFRMRGVSGADLDVVAVAVVRPGAPIMAEAGLRRLRLCVAADRAAVRNGPVVGAVGLGDGNRLIIVLRMGVRAGGQAVDEQVVEPVLGIGGRGARRREGAHVIELPGKAGNDHMALSQRIFRQRGLAEVIAQDDRAVLRQRSFGKIGVRAVGALQQLVGQRLQVGQRAGHQPVVRREQVVVARVVPVDGDAAGQRGVDLAAGPAAVARAVDQHAAGRGVGLQLVVLRQQAVIGRRILVVGDVDDRVIGQLQRRQLLRGGHVPAGDIAVGDQLVEQRVVRLHRPRDAVADQQDVFIRAQRVDRFGHGVAADRAGVSDVAVRGRGGVLVGDDHVVVRVVGGQRLGAHVAADGAGIDDLAVRGTAHRRGIARLLVTVLRGDRRIIVIAAARAFAAHQAVHGARGGAYHRRLIVVPQRGELLGVAVAHGVAAHAALLHLARLRAGGIHGAVYGIHVPHRGYGLALASPAAGAGPVGDGPGGAGRLGLVGPSVVVVFQREQGQRNGLAARAADEERITGRDTGGSAFDGPRGLRAGIALRVQRVVQRLRRRVDRVLVAGRVAVAQIEEDIGSRAQRRHQRGGLVFMRLIHVARVGVGLAQRGGIDGDARRMVIRVQEIAARAAVQIGTIVRRVQRGAGVPAVAEIIVSPLLRLDRFVFVLAYHGKAVDGGAEVAVIGGVKIDALRAAG